MTELQHNLKITIEHLAEEIKKIDDQIILSEFTKTRPDSRVTTEKILAYKDAIGVLWEKVEEIQDEICREKA